MKTKDNHEVRIGDWLIDDQGVWEVAEPINCGMFGTIFKLREIVFIEIDGIGTDAFTYGADRYLTGHEIGYMYYK